MTVKRINSQINKSSSKVLNGQPFMNRELSWLAFNERVLHEALDPRNPLLERLRFFDIYTSNLDEFYMKRVGLLKKQVSSAYSFFSVDGKTPEEQLKHIRSEVLKQNQTLVKNFEQVVFPALLKENIFLVNWSGLKKNERAYANHYFRENIFPILIPLAVDSGHPFPFISNLSKSIGVCLKRPGSKAKQFARIKIPDEIPQWIRVNPKEKGPFRFVNIEELIVHNLRSLFTGMSIETVMLFRVTRNAEWMDEDEEASDLMELVEEGLKERRFAPIVRLEYQYNSDPWILNFLKDELELSDADLYEMPSLVNFTDFRSIYSIDRPDLKFSPWVPKTPKEFTESNRDENLNIFHVIRKKDLLVHHPFESFNHTVEKFIKSAAQDPHVLAIKMTLYRTDTTGQIVDALVYAAENGKQVACIVELKARFDEENNIYVAQKMEKAGIHVTYGVIGLKTHAKMILVVRKDHNGIRPYVHIGTGNYNAQTAKLYTDYGLFTCDKGIGEEVNEVFNFLTGRSLKSSYKHLLVAPFNMKSVFLKKIENEIQLAKQKKGGLIVAKMNSLEDQEIMEALYRASQSGVKITLIVRGFCCLRAGVPGLSDHIQVISVVGRFLEHSRVFYFNNGAKSPEEGEFYIGSADWMYRNLHNRVEVVAPINRKELKRKIWDMLCLIMNDRRQSWLLKGDGKYLKLMPKAKEQETGIHQILMDKAKRSFISVKE